MANYNKVILAGNLTRDPQLSYTPNNTAVTEFGLAINRRWKSQDGESRDETCFVDCRIYGRQAETFNEYMSKGRPILVEGRLQYQQWTAKDGGKRSKHMVIVENFQFLGGRDSGGGGSGGSGSGGSGSGGGGRSGSTADAGSEAPPPPSDDDIPF